MEPGPPKKSDPSSSLPREVADTANTRGTLVEPFHDRPAVADTFLSPPQRPDEVGRLGPYRVLAELGRGGMGVVFRAEDPALKRAVALKVLLPELAADPRARERFMREAEAQAKVEHDHIIVIHAVGEADGVAFIVMPLLKGLSLAAALKIRPRPPLPSLVRIGKEIAEGLAAAHAAGLIHRDIKPANIWLEGDRRRVKILDFGVARTAAPADRHTASGAIVGSPAYMSPEQAHGQPTDPRSDLFSLGVVLYEMAAGERPFTGPSVMDVLNAVVTHHPPPVHERNPEVPPPLADLIHRLLAKDPDGRPPTAKAVARELDAIAATLVALPVPVVVTPLTAAPAEPNPWAELDATAAEDEPPEDVATVAMTRPPRRGRPVWVRPAVAGGAVALLVAVGLLVAKPWQGRPQTESAAEPAPQPRPQPAPAPPVPPVAKGDDRTAAEWALGISRHGHSEVKVRQNGVVTAFHSTDARLPPGPLELVELTLGDNSRLTDADLAHLTGCANLTLLSLYAADVTDAGLAHLRGLPALQTINLNYTRVTGRGLAALKDCPKLHSVTAQGVMLGGDVAALADLPALEYAQVSKAGVTDAGAELFRRKRGEQGRSDCLQLADLDRPVAGLAFDGKTTSVTVPTLQFDGKLPVTVEAWLTPHSFTAGTEHFLCLLGEPSGGLLVDKTGGFGVVFPNNTERWPQDYSRVKLTPGRTVHLAAVVREDVILLFLDGKEVGINRISVGPLIKTTPPAVIGKGTRFTGGGKHFHGVMHALRVSRAARYDERGFVPHPDWRPDADTLALYRFDEDRFDERRGTKLTDHSGNGHHGEVAGGAWVRARPTGGLAFDGKTTFVSVSDLAFDGTLPITIEAWVTPAAVGETHFVLLGEPGGGIGLNPAGRPGVGFWDGAKWQNWYAPNPLEVGQPYHLAAVVSRDGVQLFVDGSELVSKEAKLSLPATAPPAVIGKATAAAGGASHFSGTIHGVRVSRGARYDRYFIPPPPLLWTPDADTLALYRFDEGKGTELIDSSPHKRNGKIEGGTWVAPK